MIKKLRIIIFFFPVFLSCGDRNYWHEIEYYNVDKNNTIISTQIENANNFSNLVLSSYFSQVEMEVNPLFRDSLYLNQNVYFRVHEVLSATKDCIISFTTDTIARYNKLIIDYTRYPAQMFILAYLDNYLNSIPPFRTYEDTLSYFEYASPNLGFQSGGFLGIMTNDTFVSNYPKLLDLCNDCTIIIRRCTFDFKAGHDSLAIVARTNFYGYHIFIGDKSLRAAFKYAKDIGVSIANMEIVNLATNSEFFKKALVTDKLRSLVNKINDRRKSMAPYDLWEFERDYKLLQDSAKILGLDDSDFLDKMLNYNHPSRIQGTLFFNFKSYIGFMIQWSCFNLTYLILLIILTFIPKAQYIIFGILSSIINVTVITVINGWIFSKIPNSFILAYWLFPALLYLLCIVMILYLKKKRVA